MQKFQDVKPYDKVITYSGDVLTVIDKGSIRDMMQKYPSQSFDERDIKSWGYTMDDDCVVVNDDGEKIIYVYGHEGAYKP